MSPICFYPVCPNRGLGKRDCLLSGPTLTTDFLHFFSRSRPASVSRFGSVSYPQMTPFVRNEGKKCCRARFFWPCKQLTQKLRVYRTQKRREKGKKKWKFFPNADCAQFHDLARQPRVRRTRFRDNFLLFSPMLVSFPATLLLWFWAWTSINIPES